MRRILGVLAIALMAVAFAAMADEPGYAGNKWYGGVGLGGFNPDDGTGTLKNQSGQAGLMFNIGYRYSDYVSFELDTIGLDQRFDTPPSITAPAFSNVDGRAHVTSAGIGVAAKLNLPLGKWVPYVGAGAGMYLSNMHVSGTVLGSPASVDERDNDFGHHFMVGFDAWLWDNWALGAEYRRTYLKGNFGGLTNGEVDLGGDTFMITGRWSPRTR